MSARSGFRVMIRLPSGSCSIRTRVSVGARVATGANEAWESKLLASSATEGSAKLVDGDTAQTGVPAAKQPPLRENNVTRRYCDGGNKTFELPRKLPQSLLFSHFKP